MKKETKRVEELQVSDLIANPVWQYVNSDILGETLVRPVKRIPVTSLTGKLVGTEVPLANGIFVWALVGNVDASNPRLTEHFLTVSFERDGKWFTLSRYHDFDYATQGPEALADFLKLDTNLMFPITYDISRYAKGVLSSLSGKILKEPREKLTRSEIIALAVP